MQFIKPIPFTEAVEKLGAKTPIGSKLTSSQWRDVPVALRERGFFSSRVESIRFLQRGRDVLTDFLEANRETLPNGKVALKAGSRAHFVRDMQQFLTAEGVERTSGGLKDITSQKRLSLIFDTQTRQAHDYGNWKQGQDPDVLNEFPAQRFIRVQDVKDPRDWHIQFENQVRLKTDIGFWIRINEDFGVPWGPWGWGCGHDVEDVDRDEAEHLGLLKRGAVVVPAEKKLNDRLEASTRGLDPDLVAMLRNAFGEQIEIDGETIRWRSGISPRPVPIEQLPARTGERTRQSPVSRALQIAVRDGHFSRTLATAARTIDDVHDDGKLPRVRVHDDADDSLGVYNLRTHAIGVRPAGSHPELTFAHEVGHLLDHMAIGTPGELASHADPLLEKWRRAIDKSTAVKELKRLKKETHRSARGQFDYWLSRHELFARAYAQYIAEKSQNPTMIEQLDRIRNGHMAPHRQWSKDDFAPIMETMNELFKGLGWL